MIQRIQTIYLLLAFAFCLACLCLPIAHFVPADERDWMSELFGIYSQVDMYNLWLVSEGKHVFYYCPVLMGILVITAGLVFIDIWLFKHRALQMRVATFCMILLVFWYIAYGIIILLGISMLFILMSNVNIFEHEKMASDRLLRITIPESLEYNGAFDDAFSLYLKKAESVGVKTAAMGSMFRLSYKIQMKDPANEKAFIDDLRTRNGNLEISILPYVEQANQL